MPTDETPSPQNLNHRAICDRVLEIVRRKTNGEVPIEATFDDLGLDSLAMAELVFEIESEFGINADGRLLDLNSVREVVEYIEAALIKRAAAASHQ